ncbi:MAG: hypothetical protein LC115_03670 [Bacteroidia bacterium]|nr:hypothetical protein [Bacteroidia bacterium]
MKSSILSTAAIALTISIFTSCNNTNKEVSSETNSGAESNTPAETPMKVITLSDFSASPDFPDAQLAIKDVKTEMKGKDSVKVTISYNVKGYELKHQTESDIAKECNNSKDGQHIHFILDNTPYAALYEPTRSFVVPVNSKHYVMSFLSRSYHESLKNKNAGVLLYFSVNEKGVYKKLDNPQNPMIFYSRPKGDYAGNDTQNILLDFYVYNATLSPNGNKVKASINDSTFTLDTWKPTFIQNAPMGALKVKLELLDKDGNTVSGENTVIERTVQLAAETPTK